eukprot:2719182-Pyramimonas_sp.AAC.2
MVSNDGDGNGVQGGDWGAEGAGDEPVRGVRGERGVPRRARLLRGMPHVQRRTLRRRPHLRQRKPAERRAGETPSTPPQHPLYTPSTPRQHPWVFTTLSGSEAYGRLDLIDKSPLHPLYTPSTPPLARFVARRGNPHCGCRMFAGLEKPRVRLDQLAGARACWVSG